MFVLRTTSWSVDNCQFVINMEDKRATAPGILKKSTAAVYTEQEQKFNQLDKKLEEYMKRLEVVETFMSDLCDDISTEEYDAVGDLVYAKEWMPDNPPRVTPRDREIAIWRSRTRNEPSLYCDEELGTQ